MFRVRRAKGARFVRLTKDMTYEEFFAQVEDVWGDFPGYPGSDWMQEVREGASRSGYWPWVFDRMMFDWHQEDAPL